MQGCSWLGAYVNDTLSKLSPLFYSGFELKDECVRAKNKLSEIKGKYNEWLLNKSCDTSNKLIQSTANAAAD